MKSIYEKLRTDNAPVEQANVCKKSQGYGMILRMYSNDQLPAHMYWLDFEGNLVTKIVLTPNIPETIDDIKVFDFTRIITNQDKKKILTWAKSNHPAGIDNWKHACAVWRDMHDE